MIIDFSGHDTWNGCPAMWWEKYVNRRRLRWAKAQRSDALCLGSLVHEGLRVWQQSHTVDIPQTVVDEMTPDKDTYLLAQELVHGYAQTYPSEQWPLILCEEPLVWQLGDKEEMSKAYGYDRPVGEDLTGLAKLDAYFYVPELTAVESGVPGLTTWLTPGWWIHEYKTKGAGVPLAMYMQSWESGLQASYQVMALTEHLAQQYGKVTDTSPRYPTHQGDVQGVLVNVLEKPKRHIPRRKCQGCKETLEYNSWLITGTGMYACPVCGHRQELMPLKQDTPATPPSYFRVVVSRSPDQLARHRSDIIAVGQQMIAMSRGGIHSHPWNWKTCVNFQYRRACDYFTPHTQTLVQVAGDDTRYEHVPDYRGLPVTEEIV